MNGNDFIANASHELRTPITIIRGYAETLRDLPALPSEQVQKMAGKIVRACDRMERLMKSLLTLSSAEHLSDRKETDLVAVAESCSEMILAAHPQVQISLKKVEPIEPIFAEPDLMEVVVLNLLENAVKYSKGIANIEIELGQKGAQVYCSVKDQGVGIAHSDIPHIFNRFYRVESRGGYGLGLFMVKKIVENHKGKVAVESAPGKGSIFTFFISSSEKICK